MFCVEIGLDSIAEKVTRCRVEYVRLASHTCQFQVSLTRGINHEDAEAHARL